MIYDHVVKINGEYYQSGEEVPELNQDTIETSEFNSEINETEPVKRGRPRKS